jgi:hypothetical protein
MDVLELREKLKSSEYNEWYSEREDRALFELSVKVQLLVLESGLSESEMFYALDIAWDQLAASLRKDDGQPESTPERDDDWNDWMFSDDFFNTPVSMPVS